MRLIDADALHRKVKMETNPYGKPTIDYDSGVKVLEWIDKVPTVDAVPVVQCKDCAVPHNKYTGCPELNGLVTPSDFFCPFGEQKKGEWRMKAIKKSTLFELARIVRKYARTGDVDILDAKTKAAKELATQAYGDDDAWIAFAEFVSAVVGAYALYPECTDKEICELFRALNFEVLDE